MMTNENTFAPDLFDTTREKLFYTLVMFPYPSGHGLHVGHASNYVINDVLARYKRMQGYTVFNPFGFDSFGLPTENYAMKLGKSAYQVTEENIAYFRNQVAHLDLSFDSERTVMTSSPDYYKWTQWIFQQLYKAGLVYRDTLRVNRCPDCQTVLANDQVVDGACERCKTDIIQKKHPQRFIKITAYAERLIADLDLVDRPEETKIAQRNWIGKSEGAEIDFIVLGSSHDASTKKKSSSSSIRRFQGDDKDNIFALYLEAFGNEKWGSIYTEEYLEKNFNNWIQSRSFIGLVSSGLQNVNAFLTAYGHGDMTECFEEMGVIEDIHRLFSQYSIDALDVYWLDDLVVDSKLRNKGIGTTLLQTFEQMMLDQKVSSIACLTLADDQLLGTFYESRGYISLGLVYDKIAKKQYSVYVKNISGEKLTVFTTRPDTIYGVTALVLAPENTLLDALLEGSYKTEVEEYRQLTLAKTAVQRQKDLKEKTGVFSGLYATHPLTGEQIPVWYADYVLPDYGTGAVMMVPAHDERDREFAMKFGISVKHVVAQHYVSGNAPISGKESTVRHNVLCILYNEDKTKVACLQWISQDRRSFVMGGVDDDNLIQAGSREILEETGYEDIVFLEEIPGEMHAEYYAAHKDVNRYSIEHCLVYKLNSDKNTGSLDGSENHTLLRIPTDEVEHFLSHVPGEVSSNLVFWERHCADNKAYTGPGKLIHSSQFTGMNSLDAKKSIADYLETIGAGRSKITYKLRDRSVSRQRYRGSPIPVYYDENNQPYLIPEEELPVLLPLDLENYKPTGKSPLEDHPTFPVYEKEGKLYRRECDTLDAFMCSSFYFLRYPDANNPDELGDARLLNKCFPVDFYIGGKEHTVGHLLYARFIHKFLFDQGYLSCPEPFQRLVHQGMVLGADGRKMSKRRGNVIDPMEIIEQYGSDVLRMYLMFMGPVEQDKVRNDGALAGIARFLRRVRELERLVTENVADDAYLPVQRLFHKTIKGLTHDMERLKFNTAVSKLMILVNGIEGKKLLRKEDMLILGQLLTPFAPNIGAELSKKYSLLEDTHSFSWPKRDELLIIDELIQLPVQINGKLRATIEISPDMDEQTVLDIALNDENIQKYVNHGSLTKVIYIPQKILNIVL